MHSWTRWAPRGAPGAGPQLPSAPGTHSSAFRTAPTSSPAPHSPAWSTQQRSPNPSSPHQIPPAPRQSPPVTTSGHQTPPAPTSPALSSPLQPLTAAALHLLPAPPLLSLSITRPSPNCSVPICLATDDAEPSRPMSTVAAAPPQPMRDALVSEKLRPLPGIGIGAGGGPGPRWGRWARVAASSSR